MKLILAMAALIASCGPARPMKYECPVSITAMTFHGEFELDCTVVEQNVRLAQRILYEHGLETPREFEDLYRGMNVYIYDEDYLSYDLKSDSYVVGFYMSGRGIETTRDGLSLLHELLHHLDAVYLQIGTAWHEGWTTNGYHEADLEYWQTAIPYKTTNYRWSGPGEYR